MFEDPCTPVILYRAKNLIEAQAVHDALEVEGISSRIEGEFLTGALGAVPLGNHTAPRLVVRQEEETAARAALERILHELRSAQVSDEE